MKRLLSLFLALSMVISMFPVNVTANTTEEAAETVVLETVPEAAEANMEPETEQESENVPETEPETVPPTEPEIKSETDAVQAEAQQEEPVVESYDYEVLTLGTTEVTLPAGYEPVSFWFTPEESGRYVLYTVDAERFAVNIDFNGYNNGIDRVWFDAEAGTTYEVILYAAQEESLTTDICLDKYVKPERLTSAWTARPKNSLFPEIGSSYVWMWILSLRILPTRN